MDEGYCYVCFEKEGVVPSPCGCVDRVVHRACLIRQIETSGKTVCGVCMREYPLTCETRTTTRLHYRAKCFLLDCVLLVTLLTVFTARWRTNSYYNVSIGVNVEVGLIGGIAVWLLIVALSEMWFYMHGRWSVMVHNIVLPVQVTVELTNLRVSL